MSSRRSRVAGTAIVAALASSLVFGVPTGPGAGAADPPGPADRSAASAAVGWLVDQQQPDGGFEVAAFPGFETPDAVTAIAEAAQSGSSWSTAEARQAVERLEHGGPGGPTPIDALDDWVVGGINAGEAAKLVVLVVAPLGLDAGSFGPSGTDLAALVYPGGCASGPATDGLFFLETAYVAYAGEILCGAPDAGVLEQIRSVQRADGGWNFNGSTAPADPGDPFDPNLPDVDSTALAVQALVAGGASASDPAIVRALAYLATRQTPAGAFLSFGSDDPNATAVAMLAITAVGFDPESPCWRDTAVPTAKGTPYPSPGAWIRSQQQPDGRIASPNDEFGVNTFATSQSVEGLLRSWLPIARVGSPPSCLVVAPAQAEQGPIALVPRFTG